MQMLYYLHYKGLEMTVANGLLIKEELKVLV